MLRLHIDSATREDAEPLLATGLFHGLTTNPTLLRRASLREGDLPAVYGWATAAGAQEVFLQAWGDDVDTIVSCGERLAAIGPAVVVKVPVSRSGATAAARLAALGHRVLVTAVYNAAQAVLAAAARAHSVAPYLGRMDDAGRDGIQEILAMQRALAAVGSTTRVLVASIRDLAAVVTLAQAGVADFALSPAVARTFFDEPLTTAAVEVFEAAARELAG